MATIRGSIDFPPAGSSERERVAVPFEPRELVSEALAEVEASAVARGIGLEADVAVGVPARVAGDPACVRRVLLALLDNAVKFTPSGYVHVAVTYESADQQLRIAVTDTGIGVAPDREHGLFEAGGPAPNGEPGGLTPGLAACKELAEAMDGALGIQSMLAFGSTFWFTATVTHIAGSRQAVAIGG